MHIEINRGAKTPIYAQIKKQITDMIISGELPQDYILPSERTLAEELKVNRSTVIKAYMELKADGFIESRIGSGTVVLPQLTKDDVDEKAYIPPLRWNQLESRLYAKNGEKTITKILSVFEKDKIISFASGIASEDTCELELLKKTQVDMINKYREKIFMPTGVDGNLELKNTIRGMLKESGISVSQKQIIITSGSQQGIDFFGRMLIEPGDVVLVEEPTFPGAIQVFELYGAKIIGIPMEQDGMRMDILETCLVKYRPKFIYVQPTFQNPTGITMTLEKRKELLQLAYYYQVPILEDDPYCELRFEGENVPALKALDKNDYVIYLSSFSKTISFSLRVGFAAASENVISRFTSFKQIADIQTNTQAQYLINEFIKNRYYKPHIDFLKERYKRKRDLMGQELIKSKVDGLKVFMPEGGYFIWCKLPDTIRLSELMDNLAVEGVLIMPGEVFYPNGIIGENYIRLNYSYPTEEEIVEGVKKLIKSIKKCSTVTRSARAALTSTINPFL